MGESDQNARDRSSPELPNPEMSESGDSRSRESARGWHSRGYLPHFESPLRVQHVTFHLSDSLPKSAIQKIDEQIEALPESQRIIQRRKRLHDWMDSGHGCCVLREAECAAIVQNAFKHFDGERYQLYAWVIMPNHVHVLFQPSGKWAMADIVASWKKFTSRRIKDWLRANQEIRDPGIAALPSCSLEDSPLWQPEYWDRYIRNQKHFEDALDYIHQNPAKARLCPSPESWPWSSAFKI